MAKNMYRKYTESLVETWRVPAGTLGGALVLQTGSNKVGVALTARGDVTATQDLPDGTQRTGVPIGGVGNSANTTEVARDGSWFFDVVGVTEGDTTASGGTSTKEGTAVYRTTADGTITLTSTGGVQIGRVDACWIVGTSTAVRIGAL